MKYKVFKRGNKVIAPNRQVGVIGNSINDMYVVNYIKVTQGEETYSIFHSMDLKSFSSVGDQLLFDFMKE